jgi:two-component sensor histidine kinase
MLLEPLVTGVQFITFFPAVMLVAFFRGSRAGLLTAGLCGIAGWYLFLEPTYSFRITRPDEVISLATYLLVSIVIALAIGRLVASLQRERSLHERQRLLVEELNHRVKNNLSIVQAIARQTLRPEYCRPDVRAEFDSRLIALSSAHEVLTRKSWEDVELTELIANLLRALGIPGERVRIHGSGLTVRAEAATTLTLAMHELATNALKYGALSVGSGSVNITWTSTDQRLHLEWREQDGPTVRLPEKRGFGSSMLERALAREFGGTVELRFNPEGVQCIIEAPLRDS